MGEKHPRAVMLSWPVIRLLCLSLCACEVLHAVYVCTVEVLTLISLTLLADVRYKQVHSMTQEICSRQIAPALVQCCGRICIACALHDNSMRTCNYDMQ